MKYYYHEKQMPAVVQQRLSAEARLSAEVRRTVVREVANLIAGGDGRKPLWGFTASDAMEAVRMAYDSGCISKADGEPCHFNELAECVCQRLGITLPRNPRTCAARAANRKGVRRLSLAKRYEILMGDFEF